MERYAFRMKLGPASRARYVNLHAPGNPENADIRQACSDAGIVNYTIFLDDDGQTAFGYFEAVSIQASLSRLAQHPANEPWQRLVSPLMEVAATFRPDTRQDVLQSIFHVD